MALYKCITHCVNTNDFSIFSFFLQVILVFLKSSKFCRVYLSRPQVRKLSHSIIARQAYYAFQPNLLLEVQVWVGGTQCSKMVSNLNRIREARIFIA